jgi:hypothetical protein
MAVGIAGCWHDALGRGIFYDKRAFCWPACCRKISDCKKALSEALDAFDCPASFLLENDEKLRFALSVRLPPGRMDIVFSLPYFPSVTDFLLAPGLQTIKTHPGCLRFSQISHWACGFAAIPSHLQFYPPRIDQMNPSPKTGSRIASLPAVKSGGELFIVDNGDENWKGLKYLQDWTEIASASDIATGFFEIGALLALDGQWQKLDKIRILMGKDVFARARQDILDGLKMKTEPSGRAATECRREKDNSLSLRLSALFHHVQGQEPPDDYKTTGAWPEATRQIANAVPVLLAKKSARPCLGKLLLNKKQNTRRLTRNFKPTQKRRLYAEIWPFRLNKHRVVWK